MGSPARRDPSAALMAHSDPARSTRFSSDWRAGDGVPVNKTPPNVKAPRPIIKSLPNSETPKHSTYTSSPLNRYIDTSPLKLMLTRKNFPAISFFSLKVKSPLGVIENLQEIKRVFFDQDWKRSDAAVVQRKTCLERGLISAGLLLGIG